MTARDTVALVCYDAGGARALLPVARELERRSHRTASIVGGPAARIWSEEGSELRALEMPDGASMADVASVLARERAAALVSGAGLYNMLEHTTRLAAGTIHLPVVGVLDAWLNYAERFERRDGARSVPSRPDIVCVPDRRSYGGMREAGFASDGIVITGPPNLEAAVERASALVETERVRRRAAAGATGDDVLVVFFSDPFFTGPRAEPFTGPGGLADAAGRPLYGFTPPGILGQVVAALATASRGSGRSCHLVVKPHPQENPGPLRSAAVAPPDGSVNITFTTEPPAFWIGVADVAVGMMTIALLEAAVAGMPAISVEIGLRAAGADDPCVSNALGYTRGVFDASALRETARAICARDLAPLRPTPAEPLAIAGAAGRVAGVIERALDRHAP